MARNQNITWSVQDKDLANSPLGYMVEISEDALGSKILSTHSTTDKVNEFEVSMRGNGIFESFPLSGLVGATTDTVIRMLRNGESPKSVLIVGNETVLYKVSTDCKHIMLEKEICKSHYFIDSISCDKFGNIWVKDSRNMMTVLNQNFQVVNTFALPCDCIFSVVDPFRRLLWQVTRSKIKLYRTHDMSVVFSATIPFSLSSITDWDISGPTGTLFLTCDIPVALSVSIKGVVDSFSSGATGICQWGSAGALVCKPNSIDYFNGTSVTDTYPEALFGASNPKRISSFGRDYFILTNNTGMVVKVNENLIPQWSVKLNYLFAHADVKVTPSPMELGGIIYLCSSNGVSAYRDVLDNSLNYGYTLKELFLGHSSSNYPVTAVVPELTTAHVWASTYSIKQKNNGIGTMRIGDDFIIS